ncbi:tripartite tricarboxylate transporter permease [Elioraea tepidiphila]|jgi:TctA family transporter|uniref:tripartite tricarboxylate transporter permease n=3 Tax=Elioraea tepidiphila TaxID=457934 RepID=UPI00036C5732|nr:tripartite tricarboxylate transporter permease [Elioraea tepidiphila]
MIEALPQAFALLLQPQTVLVGIGAALFGLFVGSMPGLSATMAVALLVPVSFFLDPVTALTAVVMTTAMAIFAGDIPGALMRIPGTPASAAYVDDAYNLTKQGKPELALGICLVTSAIGGLFGTAVLILLAPRLAEVALRFSGMEYFWLVALGLSCAVMVAGRDPLKGAVSLLIGLFIATIGQDVTSGYPRFTMGFGNLLSGVAFIPAMVGMFAIAEILRNLPTIRNAAEVQVRRIGSILRGTGSVLRRYPVNIVRGNTIGTAIGILPGAGADIAAWISYAVGKRFSKDPDRFGKGSEEGLVDAGAANNAAIAGAWVPALVFGIPGDSVTAIVIGLLLMKGLQPGPDIFLMNPEQIGALFLAFIIANLIMIPIGLVAIRLCAKVLTVPRPVLTPLILIFCMVGSFAIDNDPFALVIMMVMGILAWLMEENGIPVAPAILGIVLGDQFEKHFMTTMMKGDGSLAYFVSRPIAAVLAAITAVVWLTILVGLVRRGRQQEVPG